MRNLILMIMSILALTYPVRANDTVSGGLSQHMSFDMRPSYAFPSYRDDILSDILEMGNAKKTTLALSLHLQYGLSFPADSRQGRICPDAWQGIGTAVNFLGNPKGLGTPVSIYAFQGAPIWKFSDNLSLYYEWNFGASFGWLPCDGSTARSNLIVGSRVNACINLGAGLRYRLGNAFSLFGGLDLTHYSNGNTSFPNPGVNLAGIRIGVERRFSSHREKGLMMARPLESEFRRPRRPEFDLTLYGSLRKRVYRGGETPILLNGRFAVAGLDFAPMWRVTRNFRTGPSLDLQWDESTDLKRNHAYGTTSDDIRFHRPPFISQVGLGLSGRVELVMPLFSVNLGIGYNIIGPEETRATYQLANLKVRLTDSFFINIGYQLLNFQKQNNLMLGLGYSFR